MLFSLFISPVFATEINNPATCDSGTLSTDTGPTNLRANYESNQLNLKWYDDDYNRINVSSTSSDSCTYGGAINLPTPPTKTGYTFKGWKVIKYTPIEYIEGNGSQWIDTGIVLQNATYDTEIMPSTVSESNRIIGYAYNDGTVQYRMYVAISSHNGGILAFGFSNGNNNTSYGYNYLSSRALRVGVKSHVNAVFTSSDATLTIDDVQQVRSVGGQRNDPISIGICGLHNTTAAQSEYGFKGKTYYVKIYDGNNVLVGDYIPVKDSNGVACMYDKVTGNFFYNAGTGNFIAGPDL